MKSRWALVLLSIILVTVIAACAGSAASNSTSQSETKGSGPQSSQQAANKKLVISQLEETRDLRDIDPLVTMDISIPALMVYDTLLRRTPTGELKPQLAESFEHPDPLIWRFKLRKGIKYSDGSPFSAADVQATIKQIMDPKAKSGHLRLVSFVQDVRMIDDFTVDIVTKVPNELQPYFLAPIPILSDEQLAKKDISYKTEPIGTGPYLLAEWRQGESVRLKKNPQYWGEPAKWEEVVVKAVPEPSTRLADLLSGTAQLSGDLLPEMAQRVKDGGYDLLVEPGVRTAYMTFLFKPPFDNPQVRQAIYCAIDRKALAKATYGDFATPATSVVPPTFGGYAEAFPLGDYDPQRARALLKESGVKQPLRVTLDTAAMWSSMAQVIQSQLREVGIEVEINILDRPLVLDAQRLKAAKDGRILLFLALDNYQFDALRPYEAFLTADSFLKGSVNYQPNPQHDLLIKQYMAEQDPAKRKQLSAKIQESAKESMPVIWLFYPKNIYGMASSVQWEGSQIGRLEIRDIRLK